MLWAGIAITSAFILLAVFAPLMSPYDFDQFRSNGHRFPQLEAPSRDHLMGTTVQSTDVLSRVIWGARTELKVVLVSLAPLAHDRHPARPRLRLLRREARPWARPGHGRDAGVPVPAARDRDRLSPLREHRQGNAHRSDRDHGRVHPPLLPRGPQPHDRIREESYVEAARALGARPFTVIRKYVFFNVVQNVPPLATLNAADAILTLAALGFLGYGIQPTEAAEWGYDIQRAVSDASSNIWWTGMFPGLAIVLLVTGITLLGEGLNETLNPVLRKRVKVDVEFPAADPAADVS